MRVDTTANVVSRLSGAAVVAMAALWVGGCMARSPVSIMSRPTVAKVSAAPIARLESKAIDDGVALVGQRNYAEAEMQFRRAEVWYRAEGDTVRTAECLFWLGFCWEKQGRRAEAGQQYKKVIRDYPKTPAARQAAGRLRRMPVPGVSGSRRSGVPTAPVWRGGR